MPAKSKAKSLVLQHFLREQEVVTLQQVRERLGDVSPATAFRALRGVPYRSSYNENGRYYTLHSEDKYDSHGLWWCEGIGFSRDGPLTATVERLVREAPEGYTQRELQELLGVRVQNVVASLVERGQLARQKVRRLFLYLAPDEKVQQRQLTERRQRKERGRSSELPLEVVVDVLLVLIRYPASDARAVSRRLRGRSPPIRIEQIRQVFDRYELGQKKGLRTPGS